MTRKVLLVDDEANVLSAYRRQLRKRFDIETAEGAAEGLACLKEKGPFAVIVSDMTMPGMNGIALLEAVMAKSPLTVRMMLTGNADQKTAMDAVNQGRIFRFLTKPIEPEAFAAALEEALAQYRLQSAEKELLEKTLAGSVKVLVDLLSIVDPHAFGRGAVLRRWAGAMARDLALPSPWAIEMAAMLARIGEVTLPPELRGSRERSAQLSPAEQELLARVPAVGKELIANIPRMKPVADIVYYQQKHFDGGGFPADGTAGRDIPAGARLLKILDDLYAFGGGLELSDSAFESLAREPGAHDPELLEAVRARQALLQLGAGEGQGDRVIEVTPATLMVGDCLAADVSTLAGDLVLAEGYELTAPLIEKLRNLASLKHIGESIRVRRRLVSAAAE